MTLVPSHQQEVDDLFRRIKAEAPAPAKPSIFRPAPPRPAPSSDVLDHRVAEELQTMQRRIEQLGDILSADPVLLHRHGQQLQSIDLIMQQLGHLATVVASEDKKAAAERVTLTDLRNRLNRSAIRPLLP